MHLPVTVFFLFCFIRVWACFWPFHVVLVNGGWIAVFDRLDNQFSVEIKSLAANEREIGPIILILAFRPFSSFFVKSPLEIQSVKAMLKSLRMLFRLFEESKSELEPCGSSVEQAGLTNTGVVGGWSVWALPWFLTWRVKLACRSLLWWQYFSEWSLRKIVQTTS